MPAAREGRYGSRGVPRRWLHAQKHECCATHGRCAIAARSLQDGCKMRGEFKSTPRLRTASERSWVLRSVTEVGPARRAPARAASRATYVSAIASDALVSFHLAVSEQGWNEYKAPEGRCSKIYRRIVRGMGTLVTPVTVCGLMSVAFRRVREPARENSILLFLPVPTNVAASASSA